MPPPRSARSPQPERGDEQRDEAGNLDPVEHGRPGLLLEHRAHRALRERGAVRARVLSARDAAQQVARAPQLGEEPKHRDQRKQTDDELARARIAPEQIQPVRAPEEPQLGTVERGEEAERRTRAGERRPCSCQPRSARARSRGPPSTPSALSEMNPPELTRLPAAITPASSGATTASQRKDPVGSTVPADEVTRQSPRELEHHRDRHDRARARDDQPQVRLRLAEHREHAS